MKSNHPAFLFASPIRREVGKWVDSTLTILSAIVRGINCSVPLVSGRAGTPMRMRLSSSPSADLCSPAIVVAYFFLSQETS